MDFKGFMKGPILFDRKKNVVPDCTTQGYVAKLGQRRNSPLT